jgi:toxin YhaV
MLVINGWSIAAHPLFLGQLEKLIAAVEHAKVKDPETYRQTANAKLLAALEELVFRTIPDDPTRPAYRQGETLGANRKHWFRAKFGGQRFRLFFRFSSKARVIIFAWVNDEDTRRTYGSKTDAYAVFKGMLDGRNPPDDWETLLKAASAKHAQQQFDHAYRRVE